MLFIYQIRMGSLGEYVFCATSLKHLYQILMKNDHFKWEILHKEENEFRSFEEFKEGWSKWITKTPMHLGYLGGYSE